MPYCVLKLARSTLVLPVGLALTFGGGTLRGAPGQAADYFRQGLEAIHRGAFDEAEKQVRIGLKLDPNSPAGYDLLGIAYDRLDRFQDAQQAFKEALKLKPNFVPARNDLGRTLYRHGLVQAAAEQFTQALRADSRNFTANYNLGVIFLETKNYQQAAKHLAVARQQAPDDTSTLVALTKAHLGAGEDKQALAVAQQLITSNASDPAIRFTLGTLFLEWKEYKEAAGQLEIARLADPKNYEVLYDLGQAYIHLKKYAEAEDAFLHALAVRGDSIEALYQLGVVYAQSVHPDRAIEILVRARQLAPTRPDILLLLGRESIQEGFVEDAVEVLQDAVRINPEKVEPHLLLGEALTRSKQFPKALKEYEKVTQLEPSSPQFYVLLGRTLFYMGRPRDAERNLQKALELDPGNTDAAYYLGLFAANEGNYLLAEHWLLRALKSNPNHLGAVYEMGATCMKEQDYARARDYLEKAKGLSPEFSQIHYRLATVYQRLGAPQRAADEMALFKKYDALDAQHRGDYPQGVLDLLKETQSLPESERLERYREALERTLERKPDHVNILFLLAQVYLKLGQKQGAIQRLQRISALRPGDVQIAMRSASLLTAFNLGRDAAQELATLMEKNPDAPEVRPALASLYYTLHRDSEALKVLGAADGNSGRSAATHDLLGRIWSREGNSSKALGEFQRALNQEPQNESYILDCALELALAGQMDAAGSLIEKAKTKMPTSGKILFAQGLWYQLARHQEQALKSFQQAADLSWQWEVPYLAQGNLLRQSGSLSTALEILDQAASLFPSSPWPHWFKGLALMQDGTGGKARAASEFAQSLKLAENQPNAYPALLVSSLQRSDCPGATEIWTKMTAWGFAGELDPSQWCGDDQKVASRPAIPARITQHYSDLHLLVELARSEASLPSDEAPQPGL